MARRLRIAVGTGLILAVLAGCAGRADRRVAQDPGTSWTPCEASGKAFYLVCVKR